MCLTINNYFHSLKEANEFKKKFKISTKDKVVYKLLEIYQNKLYSPYQSHLYKYGELKTRKRFTFEYNCYRLQINAGLHAYQNMKKAKNYRSGNTIILKCIIPAGTPYFLGSKNDIVSLALQMPKEKK